MVNCIVSRISNRKNASKLSKDESALRRCEEHLCDSSFGVYTYSMPCDSWKFKLIWGLYNNSIKSNSLIAGQNTPPKKFGFLSKGRLNLWARYANPPQKLKKIFFLLGATRAWSSNLILLNGFHKFQGSRGLFSSVSPLICVCKTNKEFWLLWQTQGFVIFGPTTRYVDNIFCICRSTKPYICVTKAPTSEACTSP